LIKHRPKHKDQYGNFNRHIQGHIQDDYILSSTLMVMDSK